MCLVLFCHYFSSVSDDVNSNRKMSTSERHMTHVDTEECRADTRHSCLSYRCCSESRGAHAPVSLLVQSNTADASFQSSTAYVSMLLYI